MKKGKQYSKAFKRQVVLEVLSGVITKEQARRKYDIASKSAVLEWMRKIAGMNPEAHGCDPIAKLRTMSREEDKIAGLQEEIRRLKEQLEETELKGRAYQIMVEIAKEKYGIDLEKKRGAKQSKDSKKKGQR